MIPGQPNQFLWCMNTGSAEAIRWTVGRATVETGQSRPAAMRNEVVWQSEPQVWRRGSLPPYSGCRMIVDNTDVIVAMGANSRATGSGKIVRVSLNGEHTLQVVSTGHRNPSGLALLDGRLWEVEHGPKGGDELNDIRPGSDYGWPLVSKGDPDDEFHTGFLRSRPGTIDPVLTWTPAIAPSGMTAWRDSLYVSALRGTAVIELKMSGGKVASQMRVFDVGERVRDVRTTRGEAPLWVLTDGPNARLYQLSTSDH